MTTKTTARNTVTVPAAVVATAAAVVAVAATAPSIFPFTDRRAWDRNLNRLPRVMTLQQVAGIFHVSQITVRTWIKRRWVTAYRIGPRNIRFDKREIYRIKLLLDAQRKIYGGRCEYFMQVGIVIRDDYHRRHPSVTYPPRSRAYKPY